MLAGFYATAFLFHELGHRQVAKHFNLQTKFRLLTFGMILTVFGVVINIYSLTSGGNSFPSLALPGAVVVLGLSKIDRTTGLCKTAGPTVNLVYGTILFVISFIIPTYLYPLNQLIGLAANLNFMLGTFNMIPIGILDGQNIWKWNKKVYIALVGSLLTLLIITYMLVYAPISTNPYIP
jgi:Zn-dependent protease